VHRDRAQQCARGRAVLTHGGVSKDGAQRKTAGPGTRGFLSGAGEMIRTPDLLITNDFSAEVR
jgi:hypothetical protein